MLTSRGQVQINDEVVLDNVIFNINQIHGNDQRLGSWSGYFTVPAGGGEGAWRLYNEDEPVFLVLEDGRTGQINFANSNGFSVGSIISFIGSGSLK